MPDISFKRVLGEHAKLIWTNTDWFLSHLFLKFNDTNRDNPLQGDLCANLPSLEFKSWPNTSQVTGYVKCVSLILYTAHWRFLSPFDMPWLFFVTNEWYSMYFLFFSVSLILFYLKSAHPQAQFSLFLSLSRLTSKTCCDSNYTWIVMCQCHCRLEMKN